MAREQAILKTVGKPNECVSYIRRESYGPRKNMFDNWRIGRRPKSSLSGPQINGPNAYAKTKMDNVIFSRTDPGGMLRSLAIKGREGEDIEDATGLSKDK